MIPGASMESGVRRAAAATAAFLLTACGGDAPPTASGDAPAVGDSAGVRIVGHDHLDAPIWTVDLEGGVRYGRGPVDGLELFQVRQALRLGDGRVVVADGGNQRLLFFESDGGFLGSEGRRGQGPGEYQHLSVVASVPGDSLVVWDREARRVSVLDREGGFVRSFALETTEDVPFANIQRVFPDGSFLATGFADIGDGPPSGRLAPPSPLYRFGPAGALEHHFGDFVAGESFFEPFPDGGFRIHPVVFERRNTRLVAGSRLVFADNEPFEIRYLDPEGDLVQIVRGPPSAPLTDAVAAAEIERLLAEGEYDDPAPVRRILEEMERPATVPAFGESFGDRLGRVWLALLEPGRADSRTTWVVVAADGTLAGRVDVPDDFRPLDAGPHEVLGVRTDELGVERVVAATLVR